MGMMAMAYGIQDEDSWMWDGPATCSSRDEIVILDDDWAVNPPIPMTAEKAVRDDEGKCRNTPQGVSCRGGSRCLTMAAKQCISQYDNLLMV